MESYKFSGWITNSTSQLLQPNPRIILWIMVETPSISLSIHSLFTTIWLSLWSSGQDSWLQIHRSGFDSWHYQIFWEVVGLERGPLNLVGTSEDLLERNSSSSSLENRDYSHTDLPRWPRNTPLSTIVGTNVAYKQRSLGQYIFFVD
jgi:hypothetical protein